MHSDPFRTELARNTFYNKYAHGSEDNWRNLAIRCVSDVTGTMGGTTHPILSDSERQQLVNYIDEMKFLPGGRYLYYAGRPLHAWNNCFLLRAEEDTREEWAALVHRATSCLMLGGGIGIDYSRLRPSGRALRRTGGVSSGPIPLMHMVNEIGRNVMQGGSRRSAIYGSLNWQHEDINEFLAAKDWHSAPIHDGYSLADAKFDNFNFPCPLDQTNISVNYDDAWLNTEDRHLDPVFLENCRQALKTGEPGFSFNFGDRQNETLRNACTEVVSEDDSDCCNLGSVNMGNIDSVDEFKDVVRLASKFLICGTLRADLPYGKVEEIRAKNRALQMSTQIDSIFQGQSPTELSHLLELLESSLVLRQELNLFLQLLIDEDTSPEEIRGSTNTLSMLLRSFSYNGMASNLIASIRQAALQVTLKRELSSNQTFRSTLTKALAARLTSRQGEK
jgi:ribonucleoside-diphosphate reductase alpha chain